MSNTSQETEAPAARSSDIAPGTYRVRPRQCALTKNDASGVRSLAVVLELRDGRQIPWHGSLSTNVTEWPNGERGSAWDITRRALRDMGWQGSDVRKLHSGEEKLSKSVDATIDRETYQGKTRTKVVQLGASYLERNAIKGKELDDIAETLMAATEDAERG